MAALGLDTANRVADKEFSNQSKFRVVSLHFHPDVLDTFTRTNDGKLQLASDIPASLAKSLSSEGCAFTISDRHDDGTYSPLPNYPPKKWGEYIEGLEKNVGLAPRKSPPSLKKAERPEEMITLFDLL